MSANNKEFEEAIKLLDSEIKIAELNSKPKVADFGKTIYKIDDTEYFKKRLETLTFIKDTLKQFIEGDCEEDVKEAIKRLRQETCPATYMPDFDKEECLQVIEQSLTEKQDLERFTRLVLKKNVDIKGMIESDDVDHYNIKYATYERAIYCRNLGTPYCNKDFSNSGRGWVGCDKTRLFEEEFSFLKEMIAKYGKSI